MANVNDKDKKKQKIIVVSIAAVASVLMLLYIFGRKNPSDIDDSNKVALFEGGEASDINTNVPSISNRVEERDSTLMGSYASYELNEAQKRQLQEEGVYGYGSGGNSFLFQNTANVERQKAKEEEEERRKLEEELGVSSSKSMQASMQSLNDIGNDETTSKKKSKGGGGYSVYGDYSMWNNNGSKAKAAAAPKKSKNDDTVDWDEEDVVGAKEREERRQRAIELREMASGGSSQQSQHQSQNSFASTNANSNRRVDSQLNNLSASERRRLMLHSGGKYKESESIEAKIVSTGTVRAGQTVRLITTQVAYLSGKVIPSGTVIAGVVSFGENRMDIRLSTIRLKNEIVRVNLTVYSMDGLQGFAVDGFNDAEEVENEGISEGIKATGRIGRVVGSVITPKRSRRAQSLNLGRDVRCLLVNEDLKRGY